MIVLFVVSVCLPIIFPLFALGGSAANLVFCNGFFSTGIGGGLGGE